MGGYADSATVQSLLKPPDPKSEAAFTKAIMHSSPQVSAVNWIWEAVTGESLVESIITPITGDWTRIKANGDAWKNAGNAVEQVADNLSDNLPKLEPHWDGEAADAFQRHIDVLWAAALYAEGAIAKAAAKGFDFVSEQSEKLCGKALDLLTKLINKLASAIATAWIPVVGWGRAVKMVWDAYQIFHAIMGIYQTVRDVIQAAQTMLKGISEIKSGLAQIPDVRSLSDALEAGQDINAGLNDAGKAAKDTGKAAVHGAQHGVEGVTGGVNLAGDARATDSSDPTTSGSSSTDSGQSGGSQGSGSGESGGSSSSSGPNGGQSSGAGRR